MPLEEQAYASAIGFNSENLMKSIELQHVVKTGFHVAQNSDISEQLCAIPLDVVEFCMVSQYLKT